MNARRAGGLLTLLISALLAGVLVVTSLGVAGAGSTRTGDSDRQLPTLLEVQRIFPEVTEGSYDGDSGEGPFYPNCAGTDRPDGPPTLVLRFGGFWWDGLGARDAHPGSYLMTFRRLRQAKSAMRNLRRHLTGCWGYRENVDEYSRYHRIPTPPLGDERVGFQGSWQTTFEGPRPRTREIWIREGKTVVAARVSKVRGVIPADKTRRLAALVLRASRR